MSTILTIIIELNSEPEIFSKATRAENEIASALLPKHRQLGAAEGYRMFKAMSELMTHS